MLISWVEMGELAFPWRHNSYVQRHRAVVIAGRVRVVALVFAVLVPLWSVIDFTAFTRDVWLSILPYRLGTGLIFVALAWPRTVHRAGIEATLMLLILMLMPPLFQLAVEPTLDNVPAVGLAGVVRQFYTYLPYTVVAGLSVFPLTILESGLGWLSIFGFLAWVHAVDAGLDLSTFAGWEPLAGPLWLLVLIGGTAMISGVGQLQYMIALVRRVTFDPLTGALSRRTGMEMLDNQFRRAMILEGPLTVVFFDLDRFKQINDLFGHDAGDQTLRGLCRAVMAQLRQDDVMIRWGGEEFLLLLTGTDLAGARKVLSRLGAAGFGVRPDGLPVTASLGVAERISDAVQSVDALVEVADQRMYQAKLGGRNQARFGDGTSLYPLVQPHDLQAAPAPAANDPAGTPPANSA